MKRANDEKARSLAELNALVRRQTNDEGLWFIATTAPEAYLQQELRSLHAIAEWVLQTVYEPESGND